MDNAVFSNDRINTGRQNEIDLLKAFSIIMMIVTHCIDDLYIDYSRHLPFLVIDDVLAQSIGAQGFMICMGLGTVYSLHASSKDMFRRGVRLLIAGQVLNIFRFTLPGIVTYLITGLDSAKAYCMLTFSCDILQFAGLFFFFMGVFARFNIRSGGIFAISVAANILASFLCLRISTGSYVLDQFFGMFFFTDTESFFPFFCWMIYPAFGMVLGDILQHVRDKKKFYSVLLVPTAVVWGLYYYFGIFRPDSIFLFYRNWKSMSYVNILDASVQLVCNLSMLSMFYFFSRCFGENAMKPVRFISRNINRYYCVHLVIIFSGVMYISMMFEEDPVNTPICYLLIFLLIAVCTIAVLIYDRYMFVPISGFISAHRGLFYVLVMIITVGAVAFASTSPGPYPNLNNDYLEWL